MLFDQTAADRKVRQFSLAPSFMVEFEGKQPKWGPVGQFTFVRTYSRPTCNCDDPSTCGHPGEEFWQTCKRVVEGVYNIQKLHCRHLSLQWNEPKSQLSAQDMFRRMWDFKFTPPGRGLWTMGTESLMEKKGAGLNNCGFVSSEHIDEDFAGPFAFLMDMSMLGVGVGGDTRGAGKTKVQAPKVTDVPFVVEDSREGWVALTRTVLNSFVGKGPFPATIDFSKVRSRGMRIRGFGGTASGPGPLSKLIKGVTKLLLPTEMEVRFEESFRSETGDSQGLQTVFHGQGAPYKVTSTHIVDVFNMVGACVVAGGIRRSAEIMFGEHDDTEFRDIKNADALAPLRKRQAELKMMMSFGGGPVSAHQYQTEIDALEEQMQAHPLLSHRWASNNSIFAVVGMDYEDVAARIGKNGEPGLYWLENARAFGRMVDPANHKDWRAQGANPCFAGDTLIAVADGRGAVPIRQLVEEGNDVPVYSMDPKTGVVEIKMGRNPRMTREFSELVEIVLDDDSTLRVTPDHKMLLLDGTKCEAKDLQPGDSLPRFTKRLEPAKKGGDVYWQVVTDTRDTQRKGSRVFEHRLIARFHDPAKWDAMYDEAKKSGWVKGGLVVHHKDYDPRNNAPDNLEIMTFRDHAALHGRVDNTGNKNPMWGRTHSEETKQKIGQKTVERCADPVYAAKLSASHLEAERLGSSERMSGQRQKDLTAFYKEQEAKTDLKTVWLDGQLHAVRACETCAVEFTVPWGMRGQSYCSRICMNKAESHTRLRLAGQATAFADRQRQTLHDQVRVYKDLEGSLGRVPQKKEWDAACRAGKVASRFRTSGTTKNPHALTSFGHLQEVAVGYNHRVVSVRPCDGGEPVFNLSVDGHHTLGVVTSLCDSSQLGVFIGNCSEQTLECYELCCLVETYPAHHDSYEDFEKTLKMAYLYAKTVTLMPTHDPRANAVMNRNRRIGCSMSGIRQAIQKFGRRSFLQWCEKGYQYIQKVDRVYSDWLGIPLSIKTTSVKPSGTVSLLCNATPGVHTAHSEYYIRNIRVAGTSPLVEEARRCGYKVEKDAYVDDTWVISFPVKTENFDKGKRDVSIWEQMALTADMQRHWADNQVSSTVTVKPEETREISTVLEVFEDRLKSISFLPLNDSDHGYVQAPYIEITREEYEVMNARVRPMNFGTTRHEDTDAFCDGGKCAVPVT